MTTLMIAVVGYTMVYWAYRLNVTRGRRRRVKRGVWDFGGRKMQLDFEQELVGLASLFWDGKWGWKHEVAHR